MNSEPALKKPFKPPPLKNGVGSHFSHPSVSSVSGGKKNYPHTQKGGKELKRPPLLSSADSGKGYPLGYAVPPPPVSCNGMEGKYYPPTSAHPPSYTAAVAQMQLPPVTGSNLQQQPPSTTGPQHHPLLPITPQHQPLSYSGSQQPSVHSEPPAHHGTHQSSQHSGQHLASLSVGQSVPGAAPSVSSHHQPPPQPSVSQSRLSDEQLLQLGTHEVVKHLRQAESDTMCLMMEHGQMMRDVNRRMQVHLMEIRALKDVNQRLQDDNQELRDLCCFLDDDRQKGRKLAREWQRFGRYTASVMRQEVTAYQNKLRGLDSKQHKLIKDNLELKELCLYLDEERSSHQATCNACGAIIRQGQRDDGDGSSSSTNADEPSVPSQYDSSLIGATTPHRSESRERLLEESIRRQRNIFTEQILTYIHSLEQKVSQLEEEKTAVQQKVDRGCVDGGEQERVAVGDDGDQKHPPHLPPYGPNHHLQAVGLGLIDDSISLNSLPEESDPVYPSTSRPEAVVRAMKVLEVHEQLEKFGVSDDMESEDLGDREKALVREMCNVVWRKLEGSSGQQH